MVGTVIGEEKLNDQVELMNDGQCIDHLMGLYNLYIDIEPGEYLLLQYARQVEA